jgi:integrase/recombinase XerD
MKGSRLQSLIQLFFTDRLLKQLGVSPHTVAAYRDAFRLLLQFASERLRRAPSALGIEDLDAPFLGAFLDYLQEVRGNCTRTRNNRLAALHAFFQFVSISEPALALQCQRILAIPSKRHERAPVAFLTEEEGAPRWLQRPSRHLDRKTR